MLSLRINGLMAMAFLFACQLVKGQSTTDKEDYQVQLAAVKKEVWAWKNPAFDVRKIPVEYNKYSTVIIAQHIEMESTANKSLKLFGAGGGLIKSTYFVRTDRALIKINDKAALENYSEIGYEEILRRNSPNQVFKNFSNTYLGVRLIKPDGSIQEVNNAESVLTKDEYTVREAKLAVSGLEIGDIIDYFIRTVEVAEGEIENKEILFDMAEESPILSYSMHGLISKKYALEYRSMNGAPEMKVTDTGDNFELSFSKKDIPAYPIALWMSPMRQIPIVRLNMVFGYKGMDANKLNARRPGEIYKNIPQEELVEDVKVFVNMVRSEYKVTPFTFLTQRIDKKLAELKRAKVEMTPEETACVIYYYLRWWAYYETSGKSNLLVGIERNKKRMRDEYRMKYICYLYELFKDYGIKSDYVLATSKYGPENSKALLMSDFELLIRTSEGKPVYFSFDGRFTPGNYFPYYLEGQQAPAFYLAKRSRNNEDVSYFIPYSNAESNQQKELLNVRLDNSNPQRLLIDRSTTETGYMKIGDQLNLLLFEEYYEAERIEIGEKMSLTEKFADKKRTKSLATEYDQAFADARKERLKEFESAIKEHFDVNPLELKGQKVSKMGIRHNNPDLEYSASFAIDGWVKKAGNNYIMDIGKLLGTQLKLEEKFRNRTEDIYMPYARSFNWEVRFKIPDGYTVEGIDKLSVNLDNESARLNSKASIQGSDLVFVVEKAYKKGYEPASAWPRLLAMIDAAQDLYNVKVLLKKKA
ncbi:DUF3857 domain-containing protein [Flavihumibacter rivuli]|uniref:DUF3857 domain-containing protein n=1 Tax=Flavihumibacter rivuli TaxID=2838156 RepID=UPI001BDE14A9|nr:DUF3857 domain-containing protein [Flavihumibacter rivuli]ULQ55166.1 DUF3857 domain-containing protein [Flavihumibacter rivuli]